MLPTEPGLAAVGLRPVELLLINACHGRGTRGADKTVRGSRAAPSRTEAGRGAAGRRTGTTTAGGRHPSRMELGVIGLGRMGRIVADRSLAAGHDVVAFDLSAEATAAAAEAGATPADSIADLCERLDGAGGDESDGKRIWLMVPAGDAVDATLADLEPHLDADDVVVDGGNSHFEESVRRAEETDAAYLDCGTSGGPASAEAGFSLMIGGPEWAYEAMVPVFDAVATGPAGHDRMGESGAGHYVKMVHNGVEYALMQAYGEGFELLADGRYDLDTESVARTWNNGAVIRSWLLELCEEAFREEGSDLGDVADHVAGGSTGTWTVEEALEQEVPVPIIYQALAERFDSRNEGRFSRRLANRLRYGFGRHEVARRSDGA
ncbi:NADP-dependent phosphogluconate dehydrogenase [Halorubrum sp. SD626R]|uniref:NADP-dependent phosphogluconate dehydrogenase n=1 Tax=Halorubrum sp. SD626R TaxID=1419722 RepID=UPI003183E897